MVILVLVFMSEVSSQQNLYAKVHMFITPLCSLLHDLRYSR
jgi:hypothetical protein